MSDSASPIVVLAGLSGAGKSVASRALEDAGLLVVDALPAALLGTIAPAAAAGEPALAFVLDVRSGDPAAAWRQIRAAARAAGRELRGIWLEATDATIARRFAETRRPHPGLEAAGGDLAAAIRAERRLLAPVRRLVPSTGRLLTDDLEPGGLARAVRAAAGLGPEPSCELVIVSFGFRHGLPVDAELVFDVRGLRNPHWAPDLRARDGRDREVAAYALAGAEDWLAAADELIGATRRLVEGGRARLRIAVGCTGGRHRSVAVVEALAARARERGEPVRVEHRDLR